MPFDESHPVCRQLRTFFISILSIKGCNNGIELSLSKKQMSTITFFLFKSGKHLILGFWLEKVFKSYKSFITFLIRIKSFNVLVLFISAP